MASFDITDLISTGIESGVRQSQFNRDLTQRQLAGEQLAKYRNEELVLRAEQAAESRRAAKEAEKYQSNVFEQGKKEFEADTVDGMTSSKARVMDERGKPKTKVMIDGKEVELDAETVWKAEQNAKVARIQMGGRDTEKPFDFDRLSDNEIVEYETSLRQFGQPATDKFGNVLKGGSIEYPAWAQQNLARISVIKARRAANLRGGTGAVTDTPSPFMVGPYTGKPRG
jgi:hypothetical protein